MNDATIIAASGLADGIRQNASTAVLSGTIMIIAGILALLAPLAAGVSITLVVGTMVIIGVITLLLGIMLWRQFPLSGAWAIGVLFGIRLIFSGWALVFLGRSAKYVAYSQ